MAGNDSMQGSGEGISDNEARHRTIKRAESRHADFPQGTQTETEGGPGAIPYRLLKVTHPDYAAGYWRRLRALYSGGKMLMDDPVVMKEVFPPHRNEHPSVYEERCNRAFYTPYAGEIIDDIVSMLCNTPITMDTNDSTKEKGSYPPWYDAFHEDTSHVDSEVTPFNEQLRDCMLNSLICRTAWVLVDLPDMRGLGNEEPVYADRLDQKMSGALDAYAVRIEPESVIDWEEDESNTLQWALVHTVEAQRENLFSSRDVHTQRWTYYDTNGWSRYELRHKADEKPKDTDLVRLVNEGTYSTGKVPLVRLTVPEGLWAMAKLEGLAREHFNKRSGLAWAELQSLLPELYEFHGPEETSMGGTQVPGVSANQENPERATTQARGQGYVQQRGHQDRAEFVGPDPGPFSEARASCVDTKNEMHRVTHQMSLAVDTNAATVGRSGESKKQDKSSKTTVLDALGVLLRSFAEKVYGMVSCVRGEADLAPQWNAAGCDKFDETQASDEIEKGVTLEGISIPSATFQRLFKFALAKVTLGDNATADDLDDIETELMMNITDDQFSPMMDRIEVHPGAGDIEEEDLEEEDEDDDKPPAPPEKPEVGRKKMVDTRKK